MEEHHRDTDTVLQAVPPAFVRDPEYRSLLMEGLQSQARIDSLTEVMDGIRRLSDSATLPSERQRLQLAVAGLQDSIAILEQAEDSIFSLITKAESISRRSQRPFLILDTIISGIRVYHYDLDHLPMAGAEEKDKESGEKWPEKAMDPENSNSGAYTPDPFRILSQSPYDTDHYFDSLFVIPEGVFYWIQLAALSNPAPPDRFQGIWPVTMARDGDLTRYFAGRFRQLEEARKALAGVRELGFSDAYIVGYYNGRRISLARAEQFEPLKK